MNQTWSRAVFISWLLFTPQAYRQPNNTLGSKESIVILTWYRAFTEMSEHSPFSSSYTNKWQQLIGGGLGYLLPYNLAMVLQGPSLVEIWPLLQSVLDLKTGSCLESRQKIVIFKLLAAALSLLVILPWLFILSNLLSACLSSPKYTVIC